MSRLLLWWAVRSLLLYVFQYVPPCPFLSEWAERLIGWLHYPFFSEWAKRLIEWLP